MGGKKNKTKKTLRSLPDFCPGFSCQIVAMPHSFLSGSVVVIKGITDDLGQHTGANKVEAALSAIAAVPWVDTLLV